MRLKGHVDARYIGGDRHDHRQSRRMTITARNGGTGTAGARAQLDHDVAVEDVDRLIHRVDGQRRRPTQRHLHRRDVTVA